MSNWPNQRIKTITPGGDIPHNLINEVQDATTRAKHGDIARTWPIAGAYHVVSGVWTVDSSLNLLCSDPSENVLVPLRGLGKDDLLVAVEVICGQEDDDSEFFINLANTGNAAVGNYGYGFILLQQVPSGSTAGRKTLRFDETVSSELPRRIGDGELLSLEFVTTGSGTARRAFHRYKTIVRRDL